MFAPESFDQLLHLDPGQRIERAERLVEQQQARLVDPVSYTHLVEVSNDQAREEIYGMPYAEWKAKYQKEASPEQQAAFAKSQGNA